MHGRLKIKNKSALEIEKRKKFEEKCKLFKEGLDKSLQFKALKIYNKDALKLTGQLVAGNPDVYTLWNYRKEILCHLKDSIKVSDDGKIDQQIGENENENETSDADSLRVLSQDDFEAIIKEELELTKQSLIKNPKSYCVWQHRFWCLEFLTNPDYETELTLCDSYLHHDGRNFHCWDYRHMICDKINRSFKKELDFTMNMIQSNISAFSYSTLYYRSLLFTKGSNKKLINFADEWEKEYTIIENGLFTEPNDQALWFYFKWLLSTRKGKCLNANIDNRAKDEEEDVRLESVMINTKSEKVIFVFNKNVFDIPFNQIELFSSNSQKLGEINDSLQFVNCNRRIWYTNLHEKFVDHMITKNLKQPMFNYEIKLHKVQEDLYSWIDDVAPNNFNEEILSKKQLETLLELKELEPENKWLHLVLSSLVGTDQLGLLETLKKLDPLRKNYYSDQQSKLKIHKTFCEQKGLINSSLNLQKASITSLHHGNLFSHLHTIDLSENQISRIGSSFNCLISVVVLNLDKNLIDRVEEGISLPCLEVLYLQNNRFTEVKTLYRLKNCLKLKKLFIFGNSINNELSKESINSTIEIIQEKKETP